MECVLDLISFDYIMIVGTRKMRWLIFHVGSALGCYFFLFSHYGYKVIPEIYEFCTKISSILKLHTPT